ncbi:MAG TPA: nitroreductase family deazaflavin-dependent oxidoreductase [Trebonia sp.]|jgi:deazaflavin-dependent oxidoreductase (nitroreductase family)|nr:nitroreductase family deazaflavin-dependent oxidoreductase [Trebonia sp.]
MTQGQQPGKHRRESPGTLSRWFQQRVNARMNAGIRRGRQQFMGMDVLILHTVGRRSGEPRESPVSWFRDPADEEARLIVASGGGRYDPGWHFNLMAHPDQASIELPGDAPVPVTPHELDGAERDQAWARITAEQPRFAKYQQKTPDREYPVIRLTPQRPREEALA